MRGYAEVEDLEDVLLYMSWQLDDRCGAKAAESKLAQGPDRRGSRSSAIASALGKAARLCAHRKWKR